MIKLYAINCGWFIAPAEFFQEGAGTDRTRAPVPAFLIEHPGGKVLFDTGMTMRFKDYMATSRSAAAGYGVELDESQQINTRLQAMGIEPTDIDYVALSHLHHDHCAGLALIPDATLLIQRSEYEFAYGGGNAMYDKSYFDLGHPVKKLDGEYDLFGDGSLVLFPTPGHTPGHQSARVRLPTGDVILAADCCYVSEVLADFSRLTAGSCDREQHLGSLRLLKDLQGKGSRILFGHDPAQPVLTADQATLVN
jgi:N-acyl homoserine lactone hydrolase